jgi:GTP-binding protein
MKTQGPRVHDARFLAAAAAAAELPAPVAIEVAFAGRSNVGKSSLLNRMLERKSLVRTSSTPGCTRQINFFEARLAGDLSLTLVDLPGYGYARRSKSEREVWADLIQHYLLERPTLRAVVVIIDVRRGLEPDDRDLLKMIEEPKQKLRPEVSAIVVATKLDKLSGAARKPALEKLRAAAGRAVIGFSAEDGTGRAELWQRLLAAAGVGAPPA